MAKFDLENLIFIWEQFYREKPKPLAFDESKEKDIGNTLSKIRLNLIPTEAKGVLRTIRELVNEIIDEVRNKTDQIPTEFTPSQIVKGSSPFKINYKSTSARFMHEIIYNFCTDFSREVTLREPIDTPTKIKQLEDLLNMRLNYLEKILTISGLRDEVREISASIIIRIKNHNAVLQNEISKLEKRQQEDELLEEKQRCELLENKFKTEVDHYQLISKGGKITLTTSMKNCMPSNFNNKSKPTDKFSRFFYDFVERMIQHVQRVDLANSEFDSFDDIKKFVNDICIKMKMVCSEALNSKQEKFHTMSIEQLNKNIQRYLASERKKQLTNVLKITYDDLSSKLNQINFTIDLADVSNSSSDNIKSMKESVRRIKERIQDDEISNGDVLFDSIKVELLRYQKILDNFPSVKVESQIKAIQKVMCTLKNKYKALLNLKDKDDIESIIKCCEVMGGMSKEIVEREELKFKENIQKIFERTINGRTGKPVIEFRSFDEKARSEIVLSKRSANFADNTFVINILNELEELFRKTAPHFLETPIGFLYQWLISRASTADFEEYLSLLDAVTEVRIQMAQYEHLSIYVAQSDFWSKITQELYNQTNIRAGEMIARQSVKQQMVELYTDSRNFIERVYEYIHYIYSNKQAPFFSIHKYQGQWDPEYEDIIASDLGDLMMKMIPSDASKDRCASKKNLLLYNPLYGSTSDHVDSIIENIIGLMLVVQKIKSWNHNILDSSAMEPSQTVTIGGNPRILIESCRSYLLNVVCALKNINFEANNINNKLISERARRNKQSPSLLDPWSSNYNKASPRLFIIFRNAETLEKRIQNFQATLPNIHGLLPSSSPLLLPVFESTTSLPRLTFKEKQLATDTTTSPKQSVALTSINTKSNVTSALQVSGNKPVDFLLSDGAMQQDDTSWYTNEDIDKLLKYFLETNASHYEIDSDHVGFAPCLLASIRAGAHLRQEIDQLGINRVESLIKGDTVKQRFFVPVNLNNNHWVLVYFIFPNNSEGLPEAYYFDPLAHGVNQQVEDALMKLELFPPDKKLVDISEHVQRDGHNCGPWLVEAVKYIAQSGHQPMKNFDINHARKQHRNILKDLSLQRTGLESKKTENLNAPPFSPERALPETPPALTTPPSPQSPPLPVEDIDETSQPMRASKRKASKTIWSSRTSREVPTDRQNVRPESEPSDLIAAGRSSQVIDESIEDHKRHTKKQKISDDNNCPPRRSATNLRSLPRRGKR